MKSTIISILIAVAFIGSVALFSGGSFKNKELASTTNVYMENGKQILGKKDSKL